jgi:hypothetical protein
MILFLLSCTDYSVNRLCSVKSGGFDIEEVSILQDAFGEPFLRDALIFEKEIDHLQAGEYWRPYSVDIMVMLPVWYFYEYDDSYTLEVEVWDGDNPETSDPFVVQRDIILEEEEWEHIVLPSNAATTSSLEQMRAWLSFDFSEVIPETGFFNDTYVVGVKWSEQGEPAIGYSNYELPCNRNWTNYNDGNGWNLNSTIGYDSNCSWPMMKISIEEFVRNKECVEEKYEIE